MGARKCGALKGEMRPMKSRGSQSPWPGLQRHVEPGEAPGSNVQGHDPEKPQPTDRYQRGRTRRPTPGPGQAGSPAGRLSEAGPADPLSRSPNKRRSPVSKTGLICPSSTRRFRTNRGAKFGNNLGTTPVHTTATRQFHTHSEGALGHAETLATAWKNDRRARYRPGYIAWPVTSPHVTGRDTQPAWLT